MTTATALSGVIPPVCTPLTPDFGVIDMTALRVLDHVRVAVQAGVAGIVATAPFYTRTHPAEIAVHFRTIARRAGIPLYAYDLPVSVHTKLGADLLLELAAAGGPRMGRGSSALGAFKAALHLRGIIAHPTMALPQIALDAEEIAVVGKHLADAALI